MCTGFDFLARIARCTIWLTRSTSVSSPRNASGVRMVGSGLGDWPVMVLCAFPIMIPLRLARHYRVGSVVTEVTRRHGYCLNCDALMYICFVSDTVSRASRDRRGAFSRSGEFSATSFSLRMTCMVSLCYRLRTRFQGFTVLRFAPAFHRVIEKVLLELFPAGVLRALRELRHARDVLDERGLVG